MATYETTRYDFDGGNIQGLIGVDTGSILPWPTASAPSGYLNCNGAAVSRSTYSALFAVIGTTYGSGNGSTTFNVPNLETNIPLGKSGTKALASTGGANNANISGVNAANTTISNNTMASHSHPTLLSGSDRNSGGGNASPTTSAVGSNNTGGGGTHGHGINSASVSLQQPTIDINYIIKT
jgi:microcystin-dependent protein